MKEFIKNRVFRVLDKVVYDWLLNAVVSENKTINDDYTIEQDDHNTIIYVDKGTAVTITVPDGMKKFLSITFIMQGAGSVIFSVDGTLEAAGTTVATQYQAATLYHKGSDVYNLFGNLT